MKRIDSWLDIQRFVATASLVEIATPKEEVEVFARAAHIQSAKGRTFINHQTTI